ncbi:MAG: NUDIX hydrolase [Thermodesulfobacteriota bacterium]|nr:NUDIX hydrolase [Thermodesulfobacteriota bacterium]
MSAKVNTRTTAYRGRVFQLVTENITLTNGISLNIDIIRHPGAAAIIPFVKNDTVILIKQYRHAVGGYIWEIPAGTLDMGETAIGCAKRELVEETGYSGNKWQKLGEITPVPGYSDERIFIFLSTGLVYTKQKLEKDEVLDVHEVKFDDAINMIYQGEVQDSKTICGLFMAKRWLEDKGGSIDLT